MDRLPPCALESEQAIIGCCLVDPTTSFQEAQMTLKDPEFFYDLRCRIVWQVMCDMEPSRINVVSVYQRLKDGTPEQKKVGSAFLSECSDHGGGLASFLAGWVEEVQAKRIGRDLLKLCAEIGGAVYEGGDIMRLLERAESDILKIRPASRSSKSIKELLNDAIPMIEARARDWSLITGLTTGIPALDRMTDGLHGGEFIVIAAQTSHGKTALALNIAVHNALAGVSSAFCSAEMLPVRLALRALCSEARVNFKEIAGEDIVKILHVIGNLSKSPIRLESVNGHTIGQVRALFRRLKQQYGIKLGVIENIQLLLGEGDSRQERISNISSGMKSIALELDIPIIGLSQLNDDDKLRESRAIGHDADSVWVIKNDGDRKPDVQPAFINIEKSRDGQTGKVPVTFLKTITRFESASRISDDDVPTGHND